MAVRVGGARRPARPSHPPSQGGPLRFIFDVAVVLLLWWSTVSVAVVSNPARRYRSLTCAGGEV